MDVVDSLIKIQMTDYSCRHSYFKNKPVYTMYCDENSQRFFLEKSDEKKKNNSNHKMKANPHINDHNYSYSDAKKKRKNKQLIDHDYILPSMYINSKEVNKHLIDHNYYKTQRTSKFKSTDAVSLKNVKHKNINNTANEELPDKMNDHDNNRFSELENTQVVNDIKTGLTYTKVPGARSNTKVYMDNLNYRYYKHSICNKVIYLECENKRHLRDPEKCSVMATISVDMNDNRITTTGLHNHLPRIIASFKESC